MHLELSAHECEVLLHLLEQRITELGPEVRRTQKFAYKEGLRVWEHELCDLRDRLDRMVGTETGSPQPV